MGKQRNEMRKIHKHRREKARAQLKELAAGKREPTALNRLARKILRKTTVVKTAAAKKAAAGSRAPAAAAAAQS